MGVPGLKGRSVALECYEAWESPPRLCNRKAGNSGCVAVGLRVSLVCRCALACPFQIWGKHWHLTVTTSVRVFKEVGIASGWQQSRENNSPLIVKG